MDQLTFIVSPRIYHSAIDDQTISTYRARILEKMGMKNNGELMRYAMFGDLVAALYRACGKRRARGILRLAVNARLVKFPGPHCFVISRQ